MLSDITPYTASAMTSPLIDVATLADWLTDPTSTIVLDARARLGDPDAGTALWQASHIPGAQHADMDRDLSAAPSAEGGRHPLPTKADFTERLRAWGITPEHRVVIYDDSGGRIAAARSWWLLTRAGHPATYVLDGGWPAWQNAAQPIETGASSASSGISEWQPVFDDDLLADTQAVARGDALLLDARAPERFSGEHEPLDRVGGHIPGARSLPGNQLLDDDQCFLPADQLATRLPAGDNTIAYCGSGISACQIILGHAAAGRPLPRLYPGSWSAWSQDPTRPVATGRE